MKVHTIMALLVTLALTFISSAFAGECDHLIRVSLAKDIDTTNVTYRSHSFDVASYANEHRFGTRDYKPLIVNAGDGDWCFSFGTLRDLKAVMGANTGIVVTVNDQQTVRLSVNYNEFHITGLDLGDVVTIEFIQSFTPFPRSCERSVNSGFTTVTSDWGTIPRTMYTCDVEPMNWEAIEQREYTVNSDDETTE